MGDQSESGSKHIVGSVYWDTDSNWEWLFVPAVAIGIIPRQRFIEMTQPFWVWLFDIDQPFTEWLWLNYQYLAGLAVIIAVMQPITIDPDDVEMQPSRSAEDHPQPTGEPPQDRARQRLQQRSRSDETRDQTD